MGGMDGVDIDDRLVRTEAITRIFMGFDESLLFLRVDFGRYGLRFSSLESEPVHKLDDA